MEPSRQQGGSTEEETSLRFRRDAIQFLLYLLLIFILVALWSVVQTSRTLNTIEKENTLFIEEIRLHLTKDIVKRHESFIDLLPLNVPLNSNTSDSNHYTTGWVYPEPQNSDIPTLTTSTTTTTLSPLGKRVAYLWWTLAAVKLVITGISLWGTAQSCINWSQGSAGTADKAGCVTGCVATAVGTMATVNKAAFNYEYINSADRAWLSSINDAWRKRDTELAAEYLLNVQNITAAMAQLSGLPTLTVLQSNLSV
ncbi:uncharacterized protein TPHA_0A00110, partial [Tetrapisispora phaffii CBS 4417]